MDEIERRIRAARPLSGNRDLPLSDRAKRELAELLMSEPRSVRADPTPRQTGGSPKPQRFRFRPAAYALAAALAVLAVVAPGLWPGSSGQAHAATPPMLSIVPIPGAGPETVARLAEAARQTEGPLTTGGETVTIRSQNWSLSRTEVDGEFDPSLTVISPEVHTLTFFPDGSMRQEITAGYPYDASGSKVPSTTTPPGSVIDVFTFGPGENQPFFAGPAPTDPDQVGPFLTEGGGLDLNRSAANRFLAIGYLLSEQRLDHQQLAALLVYLARTGGYEVKGTTTDRLGRPALVVTAQAEGDQMEFSLLLDPTIGTILATETVYIGDTDPTLTAPTVTHYGAWENSE